MRAGNAALEQPMLFPEPEGVERAGFGDPAFASNKTAPVHRWVPWIAGFSSEFVQSALTRHLPEKGTVLDPFAGVGTTLVESILAGHKAIGFEINPYAALACRTKLTAHRLGANAVHKGIKELSKFYTSTVGTKYSPRAQPPPRFKTRGEFYSPKVLKKVLTVWDFIAAQERGILYDIFQLAFASTMVRYSNYSYEPSLGRRVSAGREDIEDFPVIETVVEKLHEFAHDIEWMSQRLNGSAQESKVFSESYFEEATKVPKGSVDLLITSPPYLNNYHYNRNTRPHLYWLNFADSPEDFKQLEEKNFGKFWQTVRELEHVELSFACKDKEILDCLKTLRTKTPEKGIYGGNGWANYAASYFNDCYRFAQSTMHVLKPGGTALVVIGNSILQGVVIPTDKYLGRIAEMAGLKLVDIHIPRATRVGNSIIQSDVRVAKAKKSDTLYEAVVELRR